MIFILGILGWVRGQRYEARRSTLDIQAADILVNYHDRYDVEPGDVCSGDCPPEVVQMSHVKLGFGSLAAFLGALKAGLVQIISA